MNSSVESCSSELPTYHQDENFCSDPLKQKPIEIFPTVWSESDDGNLRRLALNNPTFLVKNIAPQKDQILTDENYKAVSSYPYLGIDIGSQQDMKNEGQMLGHQIQGQGQEHQSSSSIGGLVRENYINLLSSEDETIHDSYKIYQNLDSSRDTDCEGETSEHSSKQEKCVDADDSKSGCNNSHKHRTLSISSEDAEYTETVLSGNSVSKVTQVDGDSSSANPVSPNPICKIDSYYSLSFKGSD